MDSRLLDRDKIQIALLFLAIRSSFNRFGLSSVNSTDRRSAVISVKGKVSAVTGGQGKPNNNLGHGRPCASMTMSKPS